MRPIVQTRAEPAELWRSLPLECLVCAAAILLAAALKLAGVMA